MIAWDKKPIFWADALSIDQTNIEERTHQITLMRDIYGGAEVAILWLGHHENGRLAFELFKTITEQWAKPIRDSGLDLKDDDLDPNFGGWMDEVPAFWLRDCSEGRKNNSWNAVRQLLDSSFWARCWTYQEVVLPKNSLMFTCGSSSWSVCRFEDTLPMFRWLSILAAEF